MGDTPIAVPTGFVDLDRLLGGLQPGTITAITGEPSAGKLTLAMDLLRSAAIRHGLPAILYTASLTQVDATFRILSAEARVPLHAIRSGQLSEDDWTKLSRRIGAVSEAPLLIDDAALLTVEEICAQAAAVDAELDLRLIVVDTLLPQQRAEARRSLADLRALARRLHCPVVVVGPLDSLPAPGTAPGAAQVDSVVFECADVVIVLHREDLHDVETARAGEADLVVVKHRNGPRDTITVAAQLHLCRFVDIAY
ncbi:DnaB-like helicase C-terminal domain-containing protein [Longispora urticae]